MPIPIRDHAQSPLFPTLTPHQIDAARTSSWLSTFEDLTTPATIIDIDELGEREAFLHWLESDSIFLPQGSSHASPNIDPIAQGEDEGEAPIYRLPKLNEAIRAALNQYGGAVFPKLNWTSPRDAAFIIPQTAHGPLYSTSPADVYLLVKSSDFVSHDTDPERAYSGSENHFHQVESSRLEIKLELVLKKFVEMNPSREFRCFVRNRVLIGICQRDVNYYDHLQSTDTQRTICDTIRALFEDEIRENYNGGDDYVFDVYLTETFTSAKIVDFGLYRSSTDPLLFTYPELQSISNNINLQSLRLPILKTIDSRSHPTATRNLPTFSENMMPIEMIEMSQGRNVDEFRRAWQEAVAAGMEDDDDEREEEE